MAGRAGGKAGAQLARLADDAAPLVAQYVAAMDAMRFKEAVRIVMAISAAGNKFIQARTLLPAPQCLQVCLTTDC